MTLEKTTSTAALGAFRAAAWLGCMGVALGAFSAHWLKDDLARRNMSAVWDKAVFYHLVHAVVMLLLGGRRPFPATAWWLFGAGVLCFSGSLYVWALTGIYWLVFVTPLGGLCLLLGWLWLALGRGPVTTATIHDESP